MVIGSESVKRCLLIFLLYPVKECDLSSKQAEAKFSLKLFQGRKYFTVVKVTTSKKVTFGFTLNSLLISFKHLMIGAFKNNMIGVLEIKLLSVH